MIWHETSSLSTEDQALLAHLSRELTEWGADRGFDTFLSHELAFSVLSYCRNRFREGPIPTDYLMTHSARALWGVGEHRWAESLLEHHLSDRELATAHQMIRSKNGLEGEVWDLSLMGALKTATYQARDAAKTWTLDLQYLPPPAASTELISSVVLRRAVDAIIPLWDEVDGQGVLGLKNLNRYLPGLSDAKKGETLDYTERILKNAAGRRNWNYFPEIMLL